MRRFIYNVQGMKAPKKYVYNSEFKEEDHPRGADGKFGGGGGESKKDETGLEIESNPGDLGVSSGKSFVSVGFDDSGFHVEQDPETGEETEVYDEYYTISSVYVEPEKRGKGLAKKMIKESISNILEKDKDAKIYLTALPQKDKPIDLYGLVDLYGSLGFSPTKEQGGEGVIMEYKGPRENNSPRRFKYHP